MIIWLASYPRSGNTLLRTILYKNFGIKTYSLYDDMRDIGRRENIGSAVGHNIHGLDRDLFYRSATESNEIYFVKSHERPPDEARAIYVVRDGRSSIISYFHYLHDFVPEAGVTLEDIIAGDCMFGSWSDHFAAWAPNSRKNTLLLRYDELARSSERALNSISQFIERPLDSTEILSFDSLKSVDSQFFRVGDDVANIGELTGEELEFFWLLHGPLMAELGYDTAPPSLKAPVRLSQKTLGKLVKLRQKIEAYELHLAGLQQAVEGCELHRAALQQALQDCQSQVDRVKRSLWWRIGEKLGLVQ
jgi:Sulfotransferase domain